MATKESSLQRCPLCTTNSQVANLANESPKRVRSCIVLLIPSDTIQTSKRPNLRPQTILVGVIGRGDYAKLIIERLLLQHHQVITVNQDTYANVCSYSILSRSPAQRRLLRSAFRIDPREQSSAANESPFFLQCLRHYLRGGTSPGRLRDRSRMTASRFRST